VIHIDSIDPDVFADVHRIDRSSSLSYFESILNNISLLKSSGYNFSNLRHCLTLFFSTYRTLEKTLQWAIHNENMLTSIFIPVVTVGRGFQISNPEFLTLDQIKTAYEIRARVERRPELLLLGPSEYFKQYQMSTCYISVDAKVHPYAAMQTIFGDLSVDKLSSVSNRSFEEISFSNLGFCENCFSSNYCFGTVAAVHNTIDSHPMCWHYYDRRAE